jgi:Transposase
MTFRACAVCSGGVFIHVAAALDDFGGVLDTGKFSADRAGYAELIDWASRLGHIVTFAIEGTGSYGAGRVAAVRRSGIGVVEVMRTDRRDRRLRAKSDCLDAENAARAVLSGHVNATPKTNDGTVEMIRQIKVAKDVALKARTAAMISLKTVIVNAPDELREQLQPLSKMALIRRCARLRPTDIATVAPAAPGRRSTPPTGLLSALGSRLERQVRARVSQPRSRQGTTRLQLGPTLRRNIGLTPIAPIVEINQHTGDPGHPTNTTLNILRKLGDPLKTPRRRQPHRHLDRAVLTNIHPGQQTHLPDIQRHPHTEAARIHHRVQHRRNRFHRRPHTTTQPTNHPHVMSNQYSPTNSHHTPGLAWPNNPLRRRSATSPAGSTATRTNRRGESPSAPDTSSFKRVYLPSARLDRQGTGPLACIVKIRI